MRWIRRIFVLECNLGKMYQKPSQSEHSHFSGCRFLALFCFFSSLGLPIQSSSVNAQDSSTPTPSTIVVPATPDVEESQTQDETQFIPLYPAQNLKRKSSSSGTEMQLNKKKIKISMGPAVDLQD
jgi:hypothetical protein